MLAHLEVPLIPSAEGEHKVNFFDGAHGLDVILEAFLLHAAESIRDRHLLDEHEDLLEAGLMRLQDQEGVARVDVQGAEG